MCQRVQAEASAGGLRRRDPRSDLQKALSLVLDSRLRGNDKIGYRDPSLSRVWGRALREVQGDFLPGPGVSPVP